MVIDLQIKLDKNKGTSLGKDTRRRKNETVSDKGAMQTPKADESPQIRTVENS